MRASSDLLGLYCTNHDKHVPLVLTSNKLGLSWRGECGWLNENQFYVVVFFKKLRFYEETIPARNGVLSLYPLAGTT